MSSFILGIFGNLLSGWLAKGGNLFLKELTKDNVEWQQWKAKYNLTDSDNDFLIRYAEALVSILDTQEKRDNLALLLVHEHTIRLFYEHWYGELASVDFSQKLGEQVRWFILPESAITDITHLQQIIGKKVNDSRSAADAEHFQKTLTIIETSHRIEHKLDEFRKDFDNSLLTQPKEKILTNFRAASLILDEWKGNFDKLPNSHLQRKETSQLTDWICAPLAPEKKGVVLLVGDAGAGKSVIMRDVLRKVRNQDIPVLGIKADRYCVDNIGELEKRLHLGEGIEYIVKELAKTNERVVVLIDQIDALSQVLSARREYLDTFNQLVFRLLEIPKIRIVISIRTYDLHNDHDFSFYRTQKHFKVGKLKIEEVRSVLQELSPGMPSLPSNLLDLLRDPLHLDVFCRIYREDLPFEKITALRGLYDELWLQKIVKAPMKAVPEKCAQLVYDLAQAMYENQNLAVSGRRLREEFPNEREYLESEGLIQETKEGVVFFHQTFYDFAFARQFIKTGTSIETYLVENGQSLHIRACLKMIVEFLRDRDRQEHLRIYRTILPSPDYYFHIKSLLLSLLGFVGRPTEAEKKLVLDIIFPDPALFKAFVAAVNSREWLRFLLEEKQLEPFLLPMTVPVDTSNGNHSPINRGNQSGLVNGLFTKHLSSSSAEILEFLCKLPELPDKIWLIQNALHNLEVWDNPLAFQLFDAYREKFHAVFFNDLLRRASRSNLGKALQYLKAKIDPRLSEEHWTFQELYFDFQEAQLIKYFLEYFPESTFDLLLDIQNRYLDAAKKLERQHSTSPIIPDYFFIEDSGHGNPGLFTLLITGIKLLSQNQSPYFRQFIDDHLKSNSSRMLRLLVEGFRANLIAYSSDVFDFFKIFMEKQGLDAGDTLAWHTRRLLEESYPFFTALQKQEVIRLVLGIKFERDMAVWEDKSGQKRRYNQFGQTCFLWLQCFPREDVLQFPGLKKIFLEMERRLEKSEDKEPSKIRMRGVSAPISKKAYEKMSLPDWKRSFAKYNEQYVPEWDSHKGGLEENARAFEEQVKSRPGKFYPLIDELTTDTILPKLYLVNGLCGLKEAKFDPEKILALIKKVDLTDWVDWHVHRLVSMCAYFINEKVEDDFYFHFLVKMATQHPDLRDERLKVGNDQNETESIFLSALNSVRGMAASMLPGCYFLRRHENLLFETLESIAETDFVGIRCQMMSHLALLTNLDKPRTLRLFLRLTCYNEAPIMEHSVWSAQYLAHHDFEQMKPYFENALAYPNLHKNIAAILSRAWIFNRSDALTLLNQFIEKSNEAKAGAIQVAAQHIVNENGSPNNRSLKLFGRFLEEPEESIIRSYDIAFSYLKPADFPHLLPLLTRFAKTTVARRNPRPFYEYLTACATTYPKACLDLVSDFDQYEKPDIRYASHYDQEPLRVVINAYNSLLKRKNDNAVFLRKALLLFDRMLLDDRFRSYATKTLEEVEQ